MNVVTLEISIQNKGWARVYLEPNNRWSAGGGRITVNLGDDYLGSHFFSHVGNETFTDFIANCGSEYLVDKLFKTKPMISVTDADELLQCIAVDYMDEIREARWSSVSKTQLRNLYNDIKGREFESMSDLNNQIDGSSGATMDAIFGDDWWFELPFKKPNSAYDWQLTCINEIQDQLKQNPFALNLYSNHDKESLR